MKRSFVLALAAVAVLSGCGGVDDESGAQTADATATQYVLIGDFNDSQLQGAWYDLEGKLAGEFDQVCGDTFCEGDFSNLTPLSFNCAVSSIRGSVHDCSWTFAGSIESVDPKTGAITVDRPTFQCHTAPKTTASKLVALLSNSADAIHETLPGTTGSLYDELVDCFQHPIGATPISFPDDPPTYIDASDYYTSATYRAKWRATKDALVLGFNNICGDTFCGSDYNDLQSLAFECSVTKSTGKIKSCDWIFGGSFAEVGKSGALVNTSATWSCPVPVKGTLSQLMTTITGPGAMDPIQLPLPGTTASAYDAINNDCLP